jgi:hypothetical protein
MAGSSEKKCTSWINFEISVWKRKYDFYYSDKSLLYKSIENIINLPLNQHGLLTKGTGEDSI